MPDTALQLSQVAKRYGRREPYVLRRVDAALPAGVVLQVEGGNGGGKSTLLRIIAGVSAPSRGKVTGRPTSVGFVPERFPPAIRFTPRDYLRHLAALRSSTSPGRALELLESLGAAGYADVPMAELSKGSCQKVALAQALAAPPGLLVLDEAWTGLDAGAQAVLTAEVQQRAADGDIVVFTDHAHRTALTPTQRWLVADGVLTVGASIDLVPGPAVVVLRGAGPDLADLAGVLSIERSADGLTVHVDSASCDQLLAAALGGGWSVHEVRPSG